MAYFDPIKDLQQREIVMSWWYNLLYNKGEKANFTRAKELLSLLTSPSIYQLAAKLREIDVHVNIDRLAVVAAVLASVRKDSNQTFGSSLASVYSSSNSGEMHFKKLLKMDKGELDKELQSFRRIIHLFKGVASVCDVAKTVYWWSDRTKESLAKEFYENF